jgi:hypothetical protein
VKELGADRRRVFYKLLASGWTKIVNELRLIKLLLYSSVRTRSGWTEVTFIGIGTHFWLLEYDVESLLFLEMSAIS